MQEVLEALEKIEAAKQLEADKVLEEDIEPEDLLQYQDLQMAEEYLHNYIIEKQRQTYEHEWDEYDQ